MSAFISTLLAAMLVLEDDACDTLSIRFFLRATASFKSWGTPLLPLAPVGGGRLCSALAETDFNLWFCPKF